jgi:hypothetical protein
MCSSPPDQADSDATAPAHPGTRIADQQMHVMQQRWISSAIESPPADITGRWILRRNVNRSFGTLKTYC